MFEFLCVVLCLSTVTTVPSVKVVAADGAGERVMHRVGLAIAITGGEMGNGDDGEDIEICGVGDGRRCGLNGRRPRWKRRGRGGRRGWKRSRSGEWRDESYDDH